MNRVGFIFALGASLLLAGCLDSIQSQTDFSPNCGDSRVDSDEMCDDGNNVDGDGCSADCTSDETCGNAVVDPGEACDDGNLIDGDGCQADCTDPGCGDAVVDVGEVCDDGDDNGAGDTFCTTGCAALQVCGNGTVEGTEVCDTADPMTPIGCVDQCLKFCDPMDAAAPHMFSLTGAEETLEITDNCTSFVTIEVHGAKGATANSGDGGMASGTLASVAAGDIFSVFVGGRDGYNGGGAGHAVDARNGGGATDVRLNGNAVSNRIIVAGGGGSSSGDSDFAGGNGGGGTCGANYCGGAGGVGYSAGDGGDGGINGGSGVSAVHAGGAGGGGLSNGGQPSCNTSFGGSCGTAGTLGTGGAGDPWENGICFDTYGGTSGGGGGYYGGGGTSVGNCGGGGGGGGSSWTGTLEDAAFSAGTNTGDGFAVVTEHYFDPTP